jgi:hypothetical protein
MLVHEKLNKVYHVEYTRSKNKIKIDIFGIIATKVVVTVGIAS